MEQKQCFKCLCMKPLYQFYRHPAMADGHLGKCKDCTKVDVRANRAARTDQYRAYYHDRARTPKGRAQQASNRKAMRAKYPDKYRTRNKFSRALQDGRITPWPVCAVPECDQKPEGHHPDYSRPLDVVWLCRTHHIAAHALVSGARALTGAES